ncbi:Hypothetical predicted protein [Mytilus galloprovincialis]|uniref:Uncharacterized protein n=1 Tax=Mytilus galloprovincialis TaxID=29158 RepID=A0A8B6HSI6_MYTGA|nr:Hypothetical predicted protein [Mytilus galloprovincialis]
MESGNTITIPNVVRTACHTKLIQMYQSYCREVEFQPLGISSLFEILEACAASKRTSLQGLDNIAAEGSEGYDNLNNLVEDLHSMNVINSEESKELTNSITSSKLYMKTDYKLHVQEENQCATHCRTWLLSDPKNLAFQSICNHHHLFKCEKCQLFTDMCDKIRQVNNSPTTSEELKEEFNKDLDDSIIKIENWGAHIVRTINQDSWRLERLGSLLQGQGIIVMDWAMKFLPQRFREKQTDWFGQRGKHWHVTVLIYVDTDNNICHRTYTHVLDAVRQDWFAVVSLLEHTLMAIKQQLPDIKEISLRSDNAGCYHCGHLWLALPGVGSRTG